MGTVYLGRHGDRWAAVKVVSPALADDPEFRSRFRRKMDVGRRIAGANVAEVYDADPDAPQLLAALTGQPSETRLHES